MAVKVLREYQQQAIDAVKKDFERGINSSVIHLFTGAGKTLVSMELVKQVFPPATHRTLFIGGVSRDLVEQTYLEFFTHFTEWNKSTEPLIKNPKQPNFDMHVPHLGIVMNTQNDTKARVIVGSIQTLVDKTDSIAESDPESLPITRNDVDMTSGYPRVSKQSKRRFLVSNRMDEILSYGLIDLWIHDEAHHAPADGSMIIINRLKELYRAINAPALKVVGNTATPIRSDGRAMSSVFERISFSRSFPWGVEMGFLAPPAEPIAVEFLNGRNGNSEDGHTMKELENWVEKFVDVYVEKGENRPTLAFVGSINGLSRIESGQLLAQEFNRRGIAAAWVHGGGGEDENGKEINKRSRKDILKRFREGQIKVLTNYNIFVEGIDIPIASCVMLARKVNDVQLTQILGRILRNYAGDPSKKLAPKKDALLIDMTGQELVAVTTGSLLGFEYDPNSKAFQIALDKGKAVERIAELVGMNLESDIHSLIDMWVHQGRYKRTLANAAYDLAKLGDINLLRKEHMQVLKSIIDYFSEEDVLSGKNFRDVVTIGTVQGGDAIYKIASIIAKSKSDWYSDQDAIMSISFGVAHSLCLIPPNYTLLDRVNELMTSLIPQPDKLDQYKPLLSFMTTIFGNFCVWHVNTSSKAIINNRPVAIDPALDRVEWKAIEYAQSLDDYEDKFAGKGKAWKSPRTEPTEKQLSFLRQLGVETKEITSKNHAGKLITHTLATKPVNKVYEKAVAKLNEISAQETN